MLQSYLNMLKIVQVSNIDGSAIKIKFKIKVKPVVDEDVVQKVLQLTKNNPGKFNVTSKNRTRVAFIPIGHQAANSVAAGDNCDDNLCFNGGYCDPILEKCKCKGHFIGKRNMMDDL